MQFQVPQFIEVEDKIFGPLTFKQFVYLAGGAGCGYLLWRVLPIYLAAPLIAATVGLGASLAFFKYNGQPFILALEHGFFFLTRSKLYLWSNEVRDVKKAEAVAATPNPANIYVPKLSESRLHELSWSLDIKERIAAGSADNEERENANPMKGIVAPVRTAREALIQYMPTETPANKPVSKSTQEFVPVSEVRDGIVILKDKSLRAVLLASSINFALKSEDEQTAFIIQFQNFLNSLDFSCQIFVQSRMLDIRPYIASLEVAYKNQLDDLMRIQIREYIGFIKSFTEAANIMTKNFFVVVPYSPAALSMSGSSIASKLSFGKTKTSAEDVNRSFEEQVSQLEQRISIVQQGLIRCGVRTVQLGTEEAIELFYKLFNPGEEGKPMPLEQQ